MRFLLICLLGVCFLGGCGTKQNSADTLDVTADIGERHRCSRISPEIEIDNYPSDTVTFDVSLQDRADLSRIHGGGMWKNDDTGIIPQGALTRHYIGACPPDDDSERSYQFVVKALDEDGLVLGQGRYIFEQD